MKLTPFSWLAIACVWVLAGCGHVDLTPEGNPNRVITGTVHVRMDLIPPPDAEVVVRLVQPADVTAAPTRAGNDLVIGERGTRERPAQVVAEQVIRTPGALPVPFRLEFRASDAELRHGLNIEGRISWGGRVRFRNVEAQLVTLATTGRPIEVWLEPVQ